MTSSNAKLGLIELPLGDVQRTLLEKADPARAHLLDALYQVITAETNDAWQQACIGTSVDGYVVQDRLPFNAGQFITLNTQLSFPLLTLFRGASTTERVNYGTYFRRSQWTCNYILPALTAIELTRLESVRSAIDACLLSFIRTGRHPAYNDGYSILDKCGFEELGEDYRSEPNFWEVTGDDNSLTSYPVLYITFSTLEHVTETSDPFSLGLLEGIDVTALGQEADGYGSNQVEIQASWPDTHAPLVTAGSIPSNGLSLFLFFSEQLDPDSVPSVDAFSLSGTSETVASVDVSGSIVILALSGPVEGGASIAVTYASADTDPIQDAAGNPVADLDDYTVTNNSTVDLDPPVIQSATVPSNGLSLALVYDEPLNTGSVPSVGAFSLTGTSATVASVGVSGSTVTLTLSGTVQAGQSVAVSYTAGLNEIQDASGNNAANLTNYAVNNNSNADTVSPVLQSATIPSNGASLALAYNENLDIGSVPSAGAYSLSGTGATVASVGVLGSTVTLTLSGLVGQGQTVTVSYTAGGSPVQDITGNNAANLTSQPVTNNSNADIIGPVIQSATVPSNGASLALVYNEPLNTGSVPSAGAYSLSGTGATVASVGVSGSTVTLTLSGLVGQGQTVTVSYTAGANPVEDLSGNNAANLSNYSVTNNSTADVVAPLLSGNPVVEASGQFIDFTFNEPMDTGSTPAAGDFSTSGTSVTIGTPVWNSATTLRVPVLGRILQSETVTTSYTAGVNPIQDVAGNNLANLSGQAVTNNSGIELETVAVTLLSNWSLADTEYVVGRPISGLTWGAGGGSDSDGSDAAMGGAGELRIWTIATALAGGISGVIGAAGVAGASGSATAGGNSTVTDASGLVVQANGGSAGNSAINTGGAGGTGGLGGTGRNGGSGAYNASITTSILGASSSGSATAASGATPGEPDGWPGTPGTSQFPSTGGSVSQSTVRNGGSGVSIVVYQRAVVASSRPRVVALSWGRDINTSTTRNVTFGGSFVAGDTLLVAAAAPTASGTASMTGYTEATDAGTAAFIATYIRTADGSDPVALATGSVRVTWATCRLRNATAANCTAGTATTTTAQSNPPSHNHGSVVDALWFACAAYASATSSVGAAQTPANYTQLFVPTHRTAAAGALLSMCMRPLLATQTEDPPQITTPVNVSGATATLCIPK